MQKNVTMKKKLILNETSLNDSKTNETWWKENKNTIGNNDKIYYSLTLSLPYSA